MAEGDESGDGTGPTDVSGSKLTARPRWLALAGALAVIAAVILYNVLSSSSDDPGDAGDAVTEASTPASDDQTGDGSNPGTAYNGSSDEVTTSTAGPADAPETSDPAGGEHYSPPPWTLIATLDEDVAGYSEPGAESDRIVAASWHDRVSSLPVIEERPEWLHVRLPQRPNGSTAWIRREDVELSSSPYRIRIDVATMRLQLYEQGELVLDAPAGVGTDDAPTTVGEFFVTFLQEPFDDGANWGPFIVVTSAHSESISDFQMSGDAIAAIHGPLGSADAIGETGAQVSKGCVRLHLDDLAVLRDVPAGSPIDIVDSSATGGDTT